MHMTCISLIHIMRFFSSLLTVTDLFILYVLFPHLRPCDGIPQRTQVLSISPYTCLHNTSKFQVTTESHFEKIKLRSFT